MRHFILSLSAESLLFLEKRLFHDRIVGSDSTVFYVNVPSSMRPQECFELHCEKKKIQAIDSTHLGAPQPSLKIRHQKQSRSHRRKGVLPPRMAQGHCHHRHEQTNLSGPGNVGQPDASPSVQYPPTHLFFRSLLNTYRRFPDTNYTSIKVVMG